MKNLGKHRNKHYGTWGAIWEDCSYPVGATFNLNRERVIPWCQSGNDTLSLAGLPPNWLVKNESSNDLPA
jgi:hypothetical protein